MPPSRARSTASIRTATSGTGARTSSTRSPTRTSPCTRSWGPGAQLGIRGSRPPKVGAAMPTWKSTMHLYPIDGAAHDVGDDDTPWAYRKANWATVYAGVDGDPANVEAIRNWTVDYFDALHPYSAGGAYVNMMMDEGQERVKASYRDNYARLARVKATYDPANVFRINQNIQPASA